MGLPIERGKFLNPRYASRRENAMFPVSGELISETRSIIIAYDFGTFRTFRPFRDILDKLDILGHLGHFARFETFGTNRTFGTKRKAAALLPESAAYFLLFSVVFKLKCRATHNFGNIS